MKKVLLLLTLTLSAMKESNEKTPLSKADLEKQEAQNVGCSCILCKGMKIAIATNVISIIATAATTMYINYAECNK